MPDIKRLNYFTGEFLIDRDFNEEQAYHRDLRRRHNLHLHTWGVANGLEVKQTGEKSLEIDPGMAIDKDGRELVLLGSETLPASGPANGTLYVRIEYGERLSDDPADQESASGAAGAPKQSKRWVERPTCRATEAKPADDGAVILLATVQLDDSGKIKAVDASIRTVAGSRIDPAADLRVRSLTAGAGLTVDNGENLYFRAGATSPADAGDIIFYTHDGKQKARIYSEPGADNRLHLTTREDNATQFTVNAKDNVSVPLGNLGVGPVDTSVFRLAVGGKYVTESGLLWCHGVSVAREPGLRGKDLLTLMRFGHESEFDYQVLHKSHGHFGRNTLGLHCFEGDSIGFFSTGWDSRFEVAGKTGDTYVKGSLSIGVSELGHRWPLKIRASGSSEELIGFEGPDGTTKWHINQNLTGSQPGLNFVETRVADGRLFLQAGGHVGIGTTQPRVPLDVPGGAVFNNVAVGINPPPDPAGEVIFPYPYETVGTTTNYANLRLHSRNSILFHVNNNRDPNMCIDTKGNVGIGKMPEVDCALDVAKVTRTGVLRIGDKWRLSGVGDAHGNDDWLRLFDAAGNGYRGGIAMDILWTGSHAYLNGTTDVNGTLLVNGELMWGRGSVLTPDQGGSIELGGRQNVRVNRVPYIDFHYKDGEDYNARIINDADGQLTVHAPRLHFLGRVGIGTTNPQAPLHVNGWDPAGIIISSSGHSGTPWNIFHNALDATGDYGLRICQGDRGITVANGEVFQDSDLSLKEDIFPITNILDKVKRLRPVAFRWRDTNKTSVGFVAQDIEHIFPELVHLNRTEDLEIRGLRYSSFGVLAIAAIQEIVQIYEQRVDALEARVKSLFQLCKMAPTS